ncbi:SUN domain-containing ossification factor [Eumeta japonica]|uniref:SUN domain-containing ossification factor n=1 Tax=Eumeta variegata TaxID=151549 RepID=A0A4C1W9N0_EUMVA|nr:SUN domain-containing ossification factor [Eumeta japonica]
MRCQTESNRPKSAEHGAVGGALCRVGYRRDRVVGARPMRAPAGGHVRCACAASRAAALPPAGAPHHSPPPHRRILHQNCRYWGLDNTKEVREMHPRGTAVNVNSETYGEMIDTFFKQHVKDGSFFNRNTWLPDTGQPPILISLVETATLELKTPSELIFGNDSDRYEDNKTISIVESHAGIDERDARTAEPPAPAPPEPTLVVQARPVQEPRPAEELPVTSPPTADSEHEDESQPVDSDKENESLTTEEVANKPAVPQEDIPSFSEWAQKQLAEAEKHTVLNHSSQPAHSATNVNGKSGKLRSKNYASPACGAKVVAVNPEAGSASAVLSPNPDEYMLNTCTSRIWFIVELCEAVQAQRIELANFELFSSTPKDFAVYFSDRFPTRDWASVGQFMARDLRDVQTFDLYPHLFGKFIKVELLSHYGAEHYCPISLFKVYGTSEFEVLEKENAAHAHADDDDDDEPVEAEPHAGDSDTAKNLFGSARDAVMSIVKKAAQVLVKTETPKNATSDRNDTTANDPGDACRSPSHIVVCDNCSETLYGDVFQLISCSSDRLASALRMTFLRDTLKCTSLCRPFGLDFKSSRTISFGDERASYLNAIFPKRYIAALCNILAIDEKKVVLNTSFEREQDTVNNVTVEESPRTTNSVTSAEPDIKLPTTNISTDDIVDLTIDVQNKEVKQEQLNDSDSKLNENYVIKEDKVDNKITVKEDITIKTEEGSSQESTETQADNKTNVEVDEKSKATEAQLKDQEPKTDNILTSDQKNGKIDATSDKHIKESATPNGDEEQMFIENDSFMSEWNQLAADPAPAGGQAPANPSTQQSLQKESVFLRLSNRVKVRYEHREMLWCTSYAVNTSCVPTVSDAMSMSVINHEQRALVLFITLTLERNMSLSGQYLEELSRRYKKQVEEMQKSFEKTVVQMNEERRRSGERENRYIEQLSLLKQQLDDLSTSVNALLEERDSWFGNLTFFKFLIYQSIVVVVVLYYVSKKRREPLVLPISKKNTKKKNQTKLRRKSVEGVSGHATPVVKKRRPSEEALRIERQSLEDLDEDHEDGLEWQVARRTRRRKTCVLHAPFEIGRNDTIGLPKDSAVPLDDDEFIAPVPEPADFSKPFQGPKKDLAKTNGSIFSNLKTKTKSRRLSSPGFLRGFSRNSTRSTPPGTVSTPDSTLGDPFERKASSESPTGSLWSASTELSQPNGGVDGPALPKPKKRSFKNILKKVF